MRDDAVLGRALPLDRGLGPHDEGEQLKNNKQWKHQNSCLKLTQPRATGLCGDSLLDKAIIGHNISSH